NPPCGIGAKMTAAPVVKFLGCAHQPQIPLLDEVYERDTSTDVATRNSDDQAHIGLDQLAARLVIASGDLPRQVNFLRMREKAEWTDVTQVALKGVFRACRDRKSTRLNSSHQIISYAVFCLKTK